ncbi:MAG: hypothetical protein Q4F34_06065 [Prevotellaceae bacterium]|nr:hypothetical protein [Prevotellaceae bacterium]
MKKIFTFAAIASLILASCTNDSLLEEKQQNAVWSNSIGFNMSSNNATRAGGIEALQTKGHYEFGVFGYSGLENDVNGDPIMENYLVAYGSMNNPYSDLATGATTWMAGSEASTTVSGNGYSSWFYEALAPDNCKPGVTPDLTQSLKYWDESTLATYFSAYAPYLNQTAVKTDEDKAVEYTESATAGEETLKFQNLSSFYTNPVTGAQITTAATPYAGTNCYDANTELINANEALYAYKNVEKTSYFNDVPVIFKHVNSQIKVKFYEVIKGYKVELIDFIPEEVASNPNYKINEAYAGVAFTPATKPQSAWVKDDTKAVEDTARYYKQAEKDALPTYFKSGDVTVRGIKGTPSITVEEDKATATNEVNENLRFAIANDKTATIATTTTSKSVNCIGEANGTATELPTTLYTLPNHDGTNYITGTVANNTGYTLHVSYKLIPEDGSKETKVYDARVYVGPEFCKWKAGTVYTYIFKITSMTNGTTDPDKIDPATVDPSTITDPTDTIHNQPLVDPDDPRVPDDPALKPIVFDGIEVEDYVTGATGKVNGDDEWTISNPSFWPSAGNYYKSPGMINAEDIANVVTPGFAVVDPTTGVVTVDATGKTFTWTEGVAAFNLTATKQVATSVAYNDAIVDKSALTVDEDSAYATLMGNITVPSYIIYVWQTATTNVSYTAVPTKIVVGCTKTPVKRTNAAGNYVDGEGNEVVNPDDAAIDYSYTFTFAPEYTNTTGITAVSASAAQAYAIAKEAATTM